MLPIIKEGSCDFTIQFLVYNVTSEVVVGFPPSVKIILKRTYQLHFTFWYYLLHQYT